VNRAKGKRQGGGGEKKEDHFRAQGGPGNGETQFLAERGRREKKKDSTIPKRNCGSGERSAPEEDKKTGGGKETF